MKTPIHETNNPFSTFALRGGRLRKSGRDVVSYAPFLMAAASAVVLGSVIALSTPSFASNNECVDTTFNTSATTGTNYTGVVLDSAITVSGRSDIDTATGGNVTTTVLGTDYYPGDSSKFYTDNTGFHKTTITTSGTASGNGQDTGVNFYRIGDGALCLINGASVTGAGYGIEGSHDGTGVLVVSNSGAIKNAAQKGISMIRSGNGDIKAISATGAISANVTGVYVKHSSAGSVIIKNSSQITVAGTNLSVTANGIEVQHSGAGDINIENSAQINAKDDGIHVLHTGAGDRDIGITLKNGSNIAGKKSGIYAKRGGGRSGDIAIVLEGGASIANESSSVENRGIEVRHEGDGLIDIDVNASSERERGSSIKTVESKGGKGILVDREGSGDVDINVNGAVWGDRHGVWVKHNGTGAVRISVLDKSWMHGNMGDGIYVNHVKGGLIDIDVEGGTSNNQEGVTNFLGRAILTRNTGNHPTDIVVSGNVLSLYGHPIEAQHTGGGKISIDINGKVSSYGGNGIEAQHSGEGNIEIDVQGNIDISWGRGMDVRHTGGGNIKIGVRGNGNVSSVSHEGIQVTHEGTGGIDIDVLGCGTVRGVRSGGIDVIHRGSGLVDINVEKEVFDTEGAGSAINVVRSTGGATAIDVSGGVVNFRGDAIYVKHEAGTGAIAIDVSGGIRSGSDNDDYAVEMQGNGTKTLTLRPGFLSFGGGKITSSGSGDSILKLAASKPDVTTAAAPDDLYLDKLTGFKTFVKEGESVWTVTDNLPDNSPGYVGSMPNAFESAGVTGGTLRFSSALFRMSGSNFFGVQNGGVLRIAGNNILEGNLNNGGQGEIVFGSGANLEVKGNYKGTGDLVFEIDDGANTWGTQGLTIVGRILSGQLRRPVLISIPANASLSLGSNDSPWLVQHKHAADARRTLRTRPNDFSFGGVLVDGTIDDDLVETNDAGTEEITIGTNIYVFDHDYVNTAGAEMNRWRLRWDKVDPEGTGATEMPDMEPDPPNDLPPDGNPPAPRFRDDVRGHAGGVRAERRNSRTLRESGAIVDGRLRTESESVRFGFDLPARSFMGGDMVLGAGVLQELSVSNVFSPDGKSTIGVKSHAASLTASWLSPAGFYADGRTRYARFSRGISTGDLLRFQDHEGTGMGVSAELGYRFAVPLGGMDFEVVPQMQLLWSRVGFEDYVSSRGGLISLEDGELMKGRLGLSWNGEWRDIGGAGRVYGGVNLRDPLDGRTAVRATGVLLTSKQSLSVDGRFGLSYEWDDGYSVYGEAKALRNGDVEEVSVNSGVSIDF